MELGISSLEAMVPGSPSSGRESQAPKSNFESNCALSACFILASCLNPANTSGLKMLSSSAAAVSGMSTLESNYCSPSPPSVWGEFGETEQLAIVEYSWNIYSSSVETSKFFSWFLALVYSGYRANSVTVAEWYYMV